MTQNAIADEGAVIDIRRLPRCGAMTELAFTRGHNMV